MQIHEFSWNFMKIHEIWPAKNRGALFLANGDAIKEKSKGGVRGPAPPGQLGHPGHQIPDNRSNTAIVP